MSKRKMSKRYPVIKKWVDGLPVNKPLCNNYDGQSFLVDKFYGKLNDAKWLHINKDVLEIARKDKDKLLHLPMVGFGRPVILTFNVKGRAGKVVLILKGPVHMGREHGFDSTYLDGIMLVEGDALSVHFSGSNRVSHHFLIDSQYDLSGDWVNEKDKIDIEGAFKVAVAAMLLIYNVVPENTAKSTVGVSHGLRCKYEKLNDLSVQVDFIDVGRLSGTSKGKPFSVAGHPRLQRVGKGLKEVKVVWVKPHVRGGRSTKSYKETLMTDH